MLSDGSGELLGAGSDLDVLFESCEEWGSPPPVATGADVGAEVTLPGATGEADEFGLIVDLGAPEFGVRGTVSETTGTRTSMALPIVPASIPDSVSVFMAMAAVDVPKTPTMMRAVTTEDFIC
ncbi:hypothetical protein GCM10027022_17820 [Alpinimonas psychrophila]